MAATLSRVFARRAFHIHVERLSAFSKGKMETSLGTVFHDVFGDEKLFILDDFNDKISGFSGGKLNFTLKVLSEKWLQVPHLPGKI